MSKEKEESSSYVLEIKTVQSQAFKILIEALKELLTDTCVEFDETGMKVVSMDTSHCVLAHLKLDASKMSKCPDGWLYDSEKNLCFYNPSIDT